VDVAADGPTIVSGLWARALAGGVALSRKSLLPGHCSAFLGSCVDSGRQTGTVYLGQYTNAVRLVVYDKRQEMLKHGHPDPGPLVRYEFRFGRKVGACMRDVSDPAPLFWRYMPGSILPRPPGIPEWVPGELIERAFERPPRDGLARRRAIVDNSIDVRKLLESCLEEGEGSGAALRGVLVMMEGRLKRLGKSALGGLPL